MQIAFVCPQDEFFFLFSVVWCLDLVLFGKVVQVTIVGNCIAQRGSFQWSLAFHPFGRRKEVHKLDLGMKVA